MQKSQRARRMEKRHNRAKRAGSQLNLVSMMDIFTILVFFLLVNSGEVNTLPSTKDVQLPESIADDRCRRHRPGCSTRTRPSGSS